MCFNLNIELNISLRLKHKPFIKPIKFIASRFKTQDSINIESK